MPASYWKLFRLKEILPGGAPILLACLDTGIWLTWQQFLLLTVGFYLLFLSSFLINEYADSFDTDQFNPERDKALTKHGVSRQFALAAFVLTSLASTLTFILLNQFWIAVAGLFLLTFYSVKPIRLKARPFLDLVAVTLGFVILPYLSYYFLINQNITIITVASLLFFSLGFMAIDLVAEGADYAADKKAGLLTTAVFLGEKRNLLAIRYLSLTSAILGAGLIIATSRWWYLYPTAAIFFLLTAANWGLTIHQNPHRLHELLRTGERFGIFISNLGIGFLFLVWLATTIKNWLF